MPIPTLITDLSTTLASNSPAGSDTVFPDLDNYVRALSGFLASIRDNSGNGWTSPYATAASPTITGTATINQLAVTTTSAFTGNVTYSGTALASGASSTMGYATGAGGSVTQLTSKATGVTLNKSTGVIVLNNALLASGATVSFTLTNSLITAKDLVIVNCNTNAGTAGAYSARINAVFAGGCSISITNNTGSGLSEAPELLFAVIKGATS